MSVKKYKGIIIMAIVLLVIGMIVNNSKYGKFLRHSQIVAEFKAASFSGKVTRIGRDQSSHNELFIYFGAQEKFSLSFVKNKNKVLEVIQVGDHMLKKKDSSYIKVYPAPGGLQMKRVEVIYY
jgi:hypothetical protein